MGVSRDMQWGVVITPEPHEASDIYPAFEVLQNGGSRLK